MEGLSLAQFPEKEEQLIAFLQKRDMLRFRSKFELVIDSLINKEFPKEGLSYHIYQITNLTLKETNNLARELYREVLTPDFFQSMEQEKSDGVREVETALRPFSGSGISGTRRTRKILDLKDMFDAEPGEEKVVSSEEQEWKDEIADIRTREREREQSIVQAILNEVPSELSEEQQKKLQDIVSSRIKNIRDAVDTRLALSRATEQGGLGLPGDEASEISLLIERQLKVRHDYGKQPNIIKKPAVRKAVLPMTPVVDEEEVNIEEMVIPTAKATQIRQPAPDNMTDMQAKTEMKAAMKKPEGIAEKKRAGLIGPIDELREITIEDWRKLFKSPDAAVQDLKEKLRILKKESFSQMIKGVNAWKKGAIVSLYLAIGSECAKEEESVTENADRRKLEGKSYLTEDEFHAIMDINKELRTYSL